MVLYDYKCPACDQIEEILHSIKENPKYDCSNCGELMRRQIGVGSCVITGGVKGSLESLKESEHSKKIKDPERAVRSRTRAFGHDAVGDPSMSTDPRHIVKRGRTLGGQQKEVNRDEFIKAAAKDDYILNQCLLANKKSANS